MAKWKIVYADGEMDRTMRVDGKPLAIVEAYDREEALRYYRADRRERVAFAGYEVTAVEV